MLPLLLAALLAGQDPAAAIEADKRCFVAYAITLGQRKDDPQLTSDEKAGMVGGLMLFLGRIEGRSGSYDIEADFRRIAEKISAAELAADTERCGAIIAERGTWMMKAGGRLRQ